MVLSVESRVYAPLSVPKTIPARPLTDAGALTDSAQKKAQSFLASLPADVRDRVGQIYREPKQRQSFSEPDRTNKDARPDKLSTRVRAKDNIVEVDFQQPIFTQPILTPGAVLLQVQFAANNFSGEETASLTQSQHEAFHAAYISAGAQPGGQAAAFAARIAEEERAERATVVFPVRTSVNLSA